MSPFRSTMAFALLASLAAAQVTWHVAAGAGPGGNGSAAQPFASIQAGIDAASTGELVSVGPGTYVELIDFHGKAIEVRGEQGASATILDAHQNYPGVLCGSGEGPGTVLRGITVRNGWTPGSYLTVGSVIVSDAGGSAMRCFASSPTVADCNFESNISVGQGGAVMVVSGTPRLHGCVFRNNFGIHGGAIAFRYSAGSLVAGCRFDHNTGSTLPFGFDTNGGAVWEDGGVRFEDSRFTHNLGSSGGAVYVHAVAVAGSAFVRCSFLENVALGGAAVSAVASCSFEDCEFEANANYTTGGASVVNLGDGGTFERCRFVGNSTAWRAGAVFNLGTVPARFINCLFTDNEVRDPHAPQPGSGNAIGGRIELLHCTVAFNGANNGWGWAALGSIITAVDTIVWNNGATVSPAITLTADHCLIQGGAPGPGNIDVDPLFADALNGDLHLNTGSPCRNAGTALVPGGMPLTDLEGNPRVWESAPDIGAYEWVAPLPGTGDDLALFTSVDGGGLAAKVHPAPIGTSAAIGVFSPNGSLFGAPGIIGIAVHPNGTMPGAVAPLPNLWIDPASAVLIPLPPIGEPGWTLEAVVPPGLSGSTVRIQGAAFTPAASNGAYALTAAHEFVAY